MSGTVAEIIGERLPRLMHEMEDVLPPGMAQAIGMLRLEEGQIARVRSALATVPDEDVDRVTDALTDFAYALCAALRDLVDAAGPAASDTFMKNFALAVSAQRSS